MWTPDFIWPELRLIVETDGYDFHRTAAQRKRDELKDAFFLSQGFVVLRLTWADVIHSPAATASRILAAVREAA